MTAAHARSRQSSTRAATSPAVAGSQRRRAGAMPSMRRADGGSPGRPPARRAMTHRPPALSPARGSPAAGRTRTQWSASRERRRSGPCIAAFGWRARAGAPARIARLAHRDPASRRTAPCASPGRRPQSAGGGDRCSSASAAAQPALAAVCRSSPATRAEACAAVPRWRGRRSTFAIAMGAPGVQEAPSGHRGHAALRQDWFAGRSHAPQLAGRGFSGCSGRRSVCRTARTGIAPARQPCPEPQTLPHRAAVGGPRGRRSPLAAEGAPVAHAPAAQT